MAQEDVQRALEAMVADDAIADQMATGDFSGVDGLDLSADEQQLVQDAAGDLPDVAGFASEFFLNFSKLDQASKIKGEFMMKWPESPAMKKAVNYGFGL